MIESIMYFGIGFLLASVSVLIVAPLVHGRAVRLTTRRLESALPMSIAEVVADKDLLRAEFAVSARRLEMQVERLTAKRARQLAEIGRKEGVVNRLNVEVAALREELRAAEEALALKARALHEAEHALAGKQTQLANLISVLEDCSILAKSDKVESVKPRMQVEMLNAHRGKAGNAVKKPGKGRRAARAARAGTAPAAGRSRTGRGRRLIGAILCEAEEGLLELLERSPAQ